MKESILSLYVGHDSAAAYINKDDELKVLEYERFVKQRYASFTKGMDKREGLGTTDDQRQSFLEYIKNDLKSTIKLILINDHKLSDVKLLKDFFPDAAFKIVLHHEAHAASGYFTSPYNDAAILSIDGGGLDVRTPAGNPSTPERQRKRAEYIKAISHSIHPETGEHGFVGPSGCSWHNVMTKAYEAKGSLIKELDISYTLPEAPDPRVTWGFTLGVAYSHLGSPISEIKPGPDCQDNSLVYAGKIMGLCGYGKVREEWKSPLQMYYILRDKEWRPTDGRDLESLSSDMEIDLSFNSLSGQDSYDLAATSQHVFENMALSIVERLLNLADSKNIIIVGGCGLNVLFNQKLAKAFEGTEYNLYIPPWPNDCGLALGQFLHITRKKIDLSVYSGFDILDIKEFNSYKKQYNATKCDAGKLVDLLKDGNIIGILQGGSEVGPRALGNRSIICDPSIKDMKDILNSKVKFREWYRPFAPVCRLQDSDTYFDDVFESKYMSYAPSVKEQYKEILPSITHVDGTARLQTVKEEDHKLFYDILTELKDRDEVPVILNTSFNMRGYPILTTIEDALKVLEETEMDYVYIEGYLFKKK